MSVAANISMAAGAVCVLGTGGIAGWIRYLHNRGSSIAGRWMAKHVRPLVAAELEPVIAQLTPNGGKSAVDRLARIDQRQQDMAVDVEGLKRHLDRQDSTMIRHLEAHAK